jgi:hypothetical protein
MADRNLTMKDNGQLVHKDDHCIELDVENVLRNKEQIIQYHFVWNLTIYYGKIVKLLRHLDHYMEYMNPNGIIQKEEYQT